MIADRWRKAFAEFCAAVALLVPTVSTAQVTIPLPQTLVLSPGGVDLQSGIYRYQHDDISSGDLTLTRVWIGWSSQLELDLYDRNENGIAHNFRHAITVQRVPRPEGGPPSTHDWLVVVHIGDRTQVFRRYWAPNAVFMPNGGGKGTSLTWTGGNNEYVQTYTFVDQDGSSYIFGTASAGIGVSPGCSSSAGPCAYVSAITRADGTRLDFDYGPVGGPLRLVRNNRGFAIALEYQGGRVTKVCALNLAYTTFNAGDSCPASAPAVAYAYGTDSYTYTDMNNAISIFSLENMASVAKSITLPSTVQPWLTLQSGCGPHGPCVGRQDFADGSWWTYSRQGANQGQPLSGSFTNAAGTTSYTIQEGQSWDRNSETYFNVPAGGPQTVTNPLQATTSADYCIWTNTLNGSVCSAQQVPQSVTSPEGNQVIFTYDNFDDPTQAVYKAKPGSGLPDRTMSATYTFESKPLSVTDARGSTTYYTYDAVHHGVLTETAPADANGVQAVKRYAYSQHYAWLYNGSGYAAAATPVWLLDSEKWCRTSATSGGACAAGSTDEVVTGYDYGPNSGPNNLLLRGKVVTAGGVSLRTCYGYDAQGNRISETTPRAGLTTCP